MKTQVTREEVLAVDLERHIKEVDRLRAENRALREALGEIAIWLISPALDAETLAYMRGKARAALALAKGEK